MTEQPDQPVLRILVATASRHAATAEIGRQLADGLVEELRSRGRRPQVEVWDVGQAPAAGQFDAVVVGSAVYLGRWLKAARSYVEREGEALRQRPVWLFSSGPVGDPLKPDEPPGDVGPLLAATGAREHRAFAGRIDQSVLGLAERAVVRALHVPAGDFRDAGAVSGWAATIATQLCGTELVRH